MKFITQEQANILPGLYQTEFTPPRERVAYVKLFHPATQWTWYIMEYDGNDTCYGLVVGHENEFGYFSLRELREVQAFGLAIERDEYFKPTQVQDLPIHNINAVVA